MPRYPRRRPSAAGTIAGGLVAVVLVIALNLALLAGAVAVVVLVLRALGVL